MNNKKIILAFVVASLCWTFSWIIMRYQSQSGVSVSYSMLYRTTISSLICFLIAYKMKHSLLMPLGQYKYAIFFGGLNIFANLTIGYIAMQYLPSGVVPTICSLSIIINELFASAVLRVKPSKLIILTGTMCFIGLICFVIPTLKFSQNIYYTASGILIAFISPIALAPAFFAQSRMRIYYQDTPLTVFLGYSFLVATILSVIWAYFTNNPVYINKPLIYILSMIYSVIFASIIGYGSLAYLVQHIGGSKACYTTIVYTVTAIGISTFLEDYSWNALNIFGFLLILFSMYIQFGNLNKLHLIALKILEKLHILSSQCKK